MWNGPLYYLYWTLRSFLMNNMDNQYRITADLVKSLAPDGSPKSRKPQDQEYLVVPAESFNRRGEMGMIQEMQTA